ncbi:nicotinate-nucleotide--dimethylbenzimidazole phosphoribosyltransferase [Oleiphilus messinensis]|uniref:Nicotinate-nucleotide--dimethylbenzimidazole phosphoribosyltransferase n=1 Tax=Oleiphilus messinensis TaxID=141451 RepID=A0A1Y0I8G3_9GAMM|nr:nicotinate-nucleotide--dimethylbenzimidazole phosphoribosyltransferase [Oleiphilus messinensis]ARU56792.1 nicotinate-nucleotide--dimethylbenzimidazole phosphoribosyltransferase [Oleiphilus messinensis]
MTLTTSAWHSLPPPALDQQIRTRALEHQAMLTKPPGALGRLEQLAVQFATWQGCLKPKCDEVAIAIFAGDHGIANEGVSAFPQAVTVEMIRNFVNGGAAINVLAKQANANLWIVNVGTVSPLGFEGENLIDATIASGTQNFLVQPAMSESECLSALDAGRRMIQDIVPPGTALFVGGEMGIANTTSASAIASLILDVSPAQLTGAGTGLAEQGIAHKCKIIEQAIQRIKISSQKSDLNTFEILRQVGGFEIAALCGAYIAAAQAGIPSAVDGFIATVAALVAVELNPAVRDWLIFSHQSEEKGHQIVLAHLGVDPLLNLKMRLGEGSGAALAISVIRSALALHAEMATFEEAAVSNQK